RRPALAGRLRRSWSESVRRTAVHRSCPPILLLAGMTLACAQSPDDVEFEPKTVTISPGPRLVVRHGDTLRVVIDVKNSQGDPLLTPISLESSNAGVATALDDGVTTGQLEATALVTAAGLGSAVITAHGGDAKGRLVLEVVDWTRASVEGAGF